MLGRRLRSTLPHDSGELFWCVRTMANEIKRSTKDVGDAAHQAAVEAIMKAGTAPKPPKCKATRGCLRLPGHDGDCAPGYVRCPACKRVARQAAAAGPDQWACSFPKSCAQPVFTSSRRVTCQTCGAMHGHHDGCEEGVAPAKPTPALVWTQAMGESCWNLALAAFVKEATTFGDGWVRTVEKVWHITPKLQFRLGVDPDLLDVLEARPRLRMMLERSGVNGASQMAVYDPAADRGNNKAPTLHEMLRRTRRKLLPSEVLRIVRRLEAATTWVQRVKRARDRHANTLDIQATNAMQGTKQQRALDALTPALVMSGLEKSGVAGVR